MFSTSVIRPWSHLMRAEPARKAPEVMALMRHAKLVLNPLPPYYESHERPFQAMAAGAACCGPWPG